MPQHASLYRVVVRNRRTVGPYVTWDMQGESAWPTLKGAESRRKKVARKFAGYDTGILTPGAEFIVNFHAALRPWLAELKPAKPVRKTRLRPRIPK